MRTKFLCGLGLLSMVVWVYAEESDPGAFQELTLKVLGQQVQDFGSAYSQGIVGQIAKESGLDESAVRDKLVELLDKLEQERKEKTKAWKGLLAVGGKETEPKQVEKFLRELSKSLRKILEKKGDYALESLVERAAGKAKMPRYAGKDVLMKALGAGGETAQAVELPAEIGVLVDGNSNYPIDRVGFDALLITREDRLHMKKVSDIHVPLTAALAEGLPQSGRIKWAAQEAPPEQEPDCQLFFEVEYFSTAARGSFAGAQSSTTTTTTTTTGQPSSDQSSSGGQQSTAAVQQTLPVVYMSAQILLKHVSTKVVLYSEAMDFSYDFTLERDPLIQSQRQLDNFYKKVAREMRQKLDEFLAGQ